MKALQVFTIGLSVCALIATISCAKKEAPSFTGTTLKVVTINVWSGLDYKGTLTMGEYETPEVREARYQALLAELKKLSPDVVGLNEANFLPDYAKRLAADLGYDYLHHVGVSGVRIGRVGLPWNLREGDAILARKELRLECAGRKHLGGGGFVWNWLSFHTDDATQVVLAKLRAGEKDVYVALTHVHASPADTLETREKLAELKKRFNYSDAELAAAVAKLESDNTWRKDEIEKLIVFLKEKVPAGAPVILMGDFNAEIDSPEMRRLSSAGYSDTFRPSAKNPGYTWNGGENANIRKYYGKRPNEKHEEIYEHLDAVSVLSGKRIDFILINEALGKNAAVQSHVCFNTMKDGVHPSDHYGVFSEIKLK